MEFKEVFEDKFEVTEDKDSRMELIAKVGQADFVNSNNRLYPHDVLDAAMKAFKGQHSFSSLDHPERQMRLKDTSHLVTDLFWSRKNLMAKITVLNTPNGKSLRELILAGGRPGLSTRGSGKSKTIKLNGKEVEEIEKGYKLQGIDFVTVASVKDSGVKTIIHESQSEERDEAEDKELEEMIKGQARVHAGVTKG